MARTIDELIADSKQEAARTPNGKHNGNGARHTCACAEVAARYPHLKTDAWPCNGLTKSTWASGCDGRTQGILIRAARAGKLDAPKATVTGNGDSI